MAMRRSVPTGISRSLSPRSLTTRRGSTLSIRSSLNRWLPLVKWLPAFPQYLIVGALVGSGYVVATSMQDGRAVSYSTPSLIGASVLIAAIALLLTTRYPPGLFDFALGIDRWATGCWFMWR
jgi:hypothetical protein